MEFVVSASLDRVRTWLEDVLRPWQGRSIREGKRTWATVTGLEEEKTPSPGWGRTHWKVGATLRWLEKNGDRAADDVALTLLSFEAVPGSEGGRKIGYGPRTRVRVTVPSLQGEARMVQLKMLQALGRRLREDFPEALVQQKAEEKENVLPPELWALEERLPNGRLPVDLDEFADLLSCYEKGSKLWRLAVGVWWVLAGKGAVTQEKVAEKLGIGSRTVAGYVKQAKSKLGVS